MNTRSFLFAISLTMILGCQAESDFCFPDLDAPVITGFVARDETGSLIQDVGNPNIKTYSGGSEANAPYRIYAYPNPCINRVTLEFISPVHAPAQIWITEAVFQGQSHNSAVRLGMTALRSGGLPLYKAEIAGGGQKRVSIDLSSVPEGYYRLYVKQDDQILYDNLAIVNDLNIYE